MTWDFDEILTNLSNLVSDNAANHSHPLLTNNPHYFISWYGNTRPRISPKRGARMLRELMQFAQWPRAKKDIENYELSGISGLQELIYFFIEAFLVLQIRPKKWSYFATRCIHGGKKLADRLVKEEMVISSDYLDAVEYLHRWVNLNIRVVKGKLGGVRNLESFANPTAEFEQMPQKSKALITAAKSFFLASMRAFDNDAKSEAVQDLRQTVNLDPLVYEWHYHLGNRIRFERKSPGGGDFLTQMCPSEEEVHTLWETYDVCDYVKTGDDGKATNLRRMALAGVCQGLAEVIRHRTRVGTQAKLLTFGGLELADNFEAVNFIREQVQVITDEGGATFAEYIRYGEIFAGILPPQFRDYKTAEKYYNVAFTMMPVNSKLNHKLGCLYFMSDELRDIPTSVRFLRRAVKIEMANVAAALDMLKVMLTSPADYLEEIGKVVEIYLKRIEVGLPSPTGSELKWLLGCAKYMSGSPDMKDDAVQDWISGQKFSPEKNIFSDAIPTMRRYHWSGNLIRLDEVKSLLQNSLVTRTDQDELAVLEKMVATFPKIQNTSFVTRGDFRATNSQPRQESDADNNWRSGARSTPAQREPPTSGGNQFRTYNHRYRVARSPSPKNWR